MQLEDLQVVLKVAQFRSITAAANHLDLRTATASAALKRVEQQLGSELFIRTTRQLRLSSAGERYLPQCEQALQLLEQAQQNIREDQQRIDGELRISLSSDLGRNLVLPWIDVLMEQHPGLRIKAHISDSLIDFYRDAVDMALRYGPPEESNLYGFKICEVPVLLCAAPNYLQKNGTPTHPDELSSHKGLFYQRYDTTHNQWEFSNGEQQYTVKMEGNRTANDGEMVKRWCVAGHGLAAKSALDVSTELRSGKLVSLMPDYPLERSELWLVFPSRQSITPAARLLRDTLQVRCSAVLQQLNDLSNTLTTKQN